jgi:hypothetical protein
MWEATLWRFRFARDMQIDNFSRRSDFLCDFKLFVLINMSLLASAIYWLIKFRFEFTELWHWIWQDCFDLSQVNQEKPNLTHSLCCYNAPLNAIHRYFAYSIIVIIPASNSPHTLKKRWLPKSLRHRRHSAVALWHSRDSLSDQRKLKRVPRQWIFSHIRIIAVLIDAAFFWH